MDSLLNFLGYILIPLTLFIGFYFSFKTRWIHLIYSLETFKTIFRSFYNDKEFSSFSALAAVLGGNLGVGNIAGIAIALHTGGPGSIIWMWVMAILASSLKFASCFLGILYREKDSDQTYRGGPMYYIKQGLKQPFIAKLFCVSMIFTSLTVGNLAQINSVAITLKDLFSPFTTAIFMALILAFIFQGGLKRFGDFSKVVVPFIAMTYISICLFIIFRYFHNLPSALSIMVTEAFSPSSFLAGGASYTLFQVIQVGFNRGLFATDAGGGIEAVIHGSVIDKNKSLKELAKQQAFISSIAPLIVVFMCTLTALTLLVTNVWKIPTLNSASMCVEAFRIGLNWERADIILSIIIFFYGVTTILTWAFCADKAFEFLLNKKTKISQGLFIVFIPLGAWLSIEVIWKLGDLAFNIMLFINLMSIIFLSKDVFQHVKEDKYDSNSIK